LVARTVSTADSLAVRHSFALWNFLVLLFAGSYEHGSECFPSDQGGNPLARFESMLPFVKPTASFFLELTGRRFYVSSDVGLVASDTRLVRRTSPIARRKSLGSMSRKMMATAAYEIKNSGMR
jgi:hypothetical protein